jgi:FkbM family methyltransferase
VFSGVGKSEYLFRPRQLVRRIWQWLRPPAGPYQQVQLPWRLPLTVRIDDIIGRQVRTFGLFELGVSEVLWRLVDPAEIAVDVGSNIGHMASLLALRVGPQGRLVAFEPHPTLFVELQMNATVWKQNPLVGRIDLHQMALAECEGTCCLHVPDDFATNRGLAHLERSCAGASGDPEVLVRRLDQILNDGETVGVMKVDVEGHELEVFRGAGELITARRIRDIVFEEHRDFPSPATTYLEENGYQILALGQTFWGPRLFPPDSRQRGLRSWETPNYLATANVEHAMARMKPWGWQCLGTAAPSARIAH